MFLCVLALVGCASTQPPRELVDARAAYQQAVSTRGAALAQGDMHEARQALGRAEASFSDIGDDSETRDLAYVAKRKAQIAESRANTFASMEQVRTAQVEREQIQRQSIASASRELERTKGEQAGQQQMLGGERRARAAADQRALEALADVKGVDTKEDERGLVMTLGSGILFPTNKSQLLRGAQEQLERVAEVLAKDSRSVIVIGHTDSTGTDRRNDELSGDRANAVRDYLVTHGVPRSRVKTEGVGSSQPIADNANAAGRAMNRRVEIILSNTP
jgi:outer membrane protein OmpA-like peptidoglycan-associated protein